MNWDLLGFAYDFLLISLMLVLNEFSDIEDFVLSKIYSYVNFYGTLIYYLFVIKVGVGTMRLISSEYILLVGLRVLTDAVC